MTPICKIKHKPTGLYYSPVRDIKYNNKYVKSNLCKLGKMYYNINMAQAIIDQIKKFGNEYCKDLTGENIKDANELVVENFGYIKV